jgi:hypothetical protein
LFVRTPSTTLAKYARFFGKACFLEYLFQNDMGHGGQQYYDK